MLRRPFDAALANTNRYITSRCTETPSRRYRACEGARELCRWAALFCTPLKELIDEINDIR